MWVYFTVPSEGALWTMRLCTENEDYINEAVHFHEEIRAESMHVYHVAGGCFFPISWLGWLHSDGSATQRIKWEYFWYFDKASRFKVLYNIDTTTAT